jgi:hypothetical protein
VKKVCVVWARRARMTPYIYEMKINVVFKWSHAHFFLKHQKYQICGYKHDCPTPYRTPCFILAKKLETNYETNDTYHQHHIVFVLLPKEYWYDDGAHASLLPRPST